jgi:two-component system alkaline phosphatase synthesis response regulator PhoP
MPGEIFINKTNQPMNSETMAKILIVDDEPEIIFLASRMLENEGHKVIGVKNSAECFEKLEEETPDLILMDIMMPDGDGWEACRKIKEDEKTSNIPVAIFTVRTSDDSREKSFKDAHADAHINKPFDKKDLLDTIENLLRSKTS